MSLKFVQNVFVFYPMRKLDQIDHFDKQILSIIDRNSSSETKKKSILLNQCCTHMTFLLIFY